MLFVLQVEVQRYSQLTPQADAADAIYYRISQRPWEYYDAPLILITGIHSYEYISHSLIQKFVRNFLQLLNNFSAKTTQCISFDWLIDWW